MNRFPKPVILPQTRGRKMALCILILVVPIASITAQEAPQSYKASDPANRNLDASLYTQTAAEYRAACYQAYNLATERLKKVADPHGKFAVITDLDETVIDNSGFMAMQLRSGLAYDQRLWDEWEQNYPDKLALVPGAKEFIHEAEAQHVAVFYISNRNDKFRAQIKYALGSLLAMRIEDEFLKLKTGSSDKTARFNEVTAAGYNVLLYLGDNLRDFDDTLKFRPLLNDSDAELQAAIKDRKAAIDKDRLKMGVEWIILPNPVYGEWLQGPLSRGRRDFDRLVPEASPSPANPVTPSQTPSAKVNQSTFLVGYLLAAMGSVISLGVLIVLVAPKERAGSPSSVLLVLVGTAEALIYVTVWLAGHPGLIVFWLAFKVGIYLIGRRKPELRRLNVHLLLIASAIPLIVAYLSVWRALGQPPPLT
jgi:5'-nucleotidase (lipoprotein e(P4) family)